MLMSFSKSTFLSFLVGASIFALITWREKLEKVVLWYGISWIIVTVLILTSYMDLYSARSDFSGRLEVYSTAQRLSQVEEAFSVIATQPLLGVGGYVQYLMEALPGRDAWLYQAVHNTPLLILAEIGLVGMVLTVVLLMMALRTLCTQQQRFSQTQKVAMVLLTMLMAHAQFDHWQWSSHLGIVLIIFLSATTVFVPTDSDF